MGGERLERQTQLEEEDNIINKWAQEDVNRLYSLLDDDNNNNKKKKKKKKKKVAMKMA
jgi:hypothetical protein